MKASPTPGPRLRLGNKAETLSVSRDVLLLVDFINPLDFAEAGALAPSALRAARATLKLKRDLATRGVPALYANDNYGQWRSDFRQVLASCKAMPGEAGQIARLLKPGQDDLAILKPRHSAFFHTPLDMMLAQMHCRRLILTGLAADICVLITAVDAHLRGYRLWVPQDCTAAESDAEKTAALHYMQRILKADIRPSLTRRAISRRA